MLEGLQLFGQGILTYATPGAVFNVLWATLLGITVGMMPGLTATLGIALMTTLTFKMAPGDAIEFRTYKKGFMIAYLGDEDDDRKGQAPGDERYVPPMRGHYYDVVTFGSRRPIHRKHYTVETVRDRPLQYEVYNGPVQASGVSRNS